MGEKMTGYIQNELIRIGKEKGFVEIDDLKRFYTKNIQQEMNKLVIKGYFEQPIDNGVKIIWKISMK
jgi:hypothetical protein